MRNTGCIPDTTQLFAWAWLDAVSSDKGISISSVQKHVDTQSPAAWQHVVAMYRPVPKAAVARIILLAFARSDDKLQACYL